MRIRRTRMSTTTRLNPKNWPPARAGSLRPAHEHDACGIGFVASIRGEKSHEIIRKGIQVLLNLTHRGACGCDPETGDGAGVLIQIPHKFFARECEQARLSHCPKPGAYGVGMTFLPVEKHQRLQCEGILERIVREEGLTLLGWRDTPVVCFRNRPRGARFPALHSADFCRPRPKAWTKMHSSASCMWSASERRTRLRDPALKTRRCFYIPSLSCRTIVYKGLLLAPQITNFYQRTFRSRRDERACAWCTSAFRRILFPVGSARIPIATSPTTAKSTPCAATSTGCRRASRC